LYRVGFDQPLAAGWSKVIMRLRCLSRIGVASVILAAVGTAAPSAHAQSFFEQLFGLGSSKPSQPPAQVIRQPAGFMTPGGQFYQPGTLQSRRPVDHDDRGDDRSSGTYRTICVRMCDGYYFPISNATTKAGFYSDQRKCQSTCGEEARLFHHPASSTNVDQAVDNSGRMYGHLQTAFLYRKKLVNGCQCKQAPWSEAEINRHKQYAVAEETDKTRQIAVADRKSIGPHQVAKLETDTAKPLATRVATKAAEAAPLPPEQPASDGVTVAPKVSKTVKSKPVGKPSTTKTAMQGKQQHAIRVPQPISGGMGLGASKVLWPGDAPPRMHAVTRIKVPRT
jgi:hypothetical protein